MVDQKDLSIIRVGHCILQDYELELHGPDSWINNLPSNRLEVYKEAFEARLRFPL